MLWILCSLAHLIMYGVKASECTVSSVEDICVYGNDKSFIVEGAPFKFFTYNSITKTNVYVCEDCWVQGYHDRAYLFGCVTYSSNYYWIIWEDYQLDQSCTAWSGCYVGDESLGPNYSFDINDCLDTNNWVTNYGDQWNDDNDMRLSTCNAICYESDVYPEINTTTSKSIESKVLASIAWNGDLYFDFSIYEEDCMNPQISFDYEVIDHDETYENIEIFDNIGMIVATCNGLQNCGTFRSCVSEYSVDDVIQMNQTYSINIHQTAHVNNSCDGYIFNAVLTLTCGSDNPHMHNIISSTSSSSTISSSSTSSSTVYSTVHVSSTEDGWVSVVITVLGVILVIIGIALYCYCKCCSCIHRILNETVKEVNEAKYAAVKKEEQKVVMTKMVILNNAAAPIHDEEQKKAFAKMVILNNASRIHDEKQRGAYIKLMIAQNPHLFQDEMARHLGVRYTPTIKQ